MITTAIALLVTIQAPQQDGVVPQKTGAAQIMSKVFGRYASAQSISGTIKMAQSAKNVTVNILSELQYDRPSKIYLHQTRDGSKPRQWLLVSDGKLFAYDRPEGVLGRDRFPENVTQNGIEQKISDIYVASALSLGDMNAMLDVAICHPNRLNILRSQWATLSYQGRVTLNGDLVHKISGQYRENPTAPVSGQYEIYVNEDGDFLRYIVNERFMFPGQSKEPVDVKTVWDSTLKVGAKTDPALYRVH